MHITNTGLVISQHNRRIFLGPLCPQNPDNVLHRPDPYKSLATKPPQRPVQLDETLPCPDSAQYKFCKALIN